jgi:uncharacterized protein YbjT (DUF2867 family)/ketosteroid isomerase-like protein
MSDLTPRSPADLYRHGLRLLLDKDIDGWVALSDENVVFEFPFAPEGAPKRLEGRAALADYMRGYTDHIDLHDFPYVEIHRTEDPETVVAEMRGVGLAAASGAPLDSSYIAVVTVRNGRITRYRDYWNPLVMPDSMRAAAPRAAAPDTRPETEETPAPAGSGSTVLVTGATGNTGSRVVRRLVALGHPVRAASRGAVDQGDGATAVRFDWDDPSTHDDALRGADLLYLVPPTGAYDPAAVMMPFLKRASAAGVRRAVLLSSSAIPAGGPGAGQVHQAVADTFGEWAVLRPSWFMQNFTDRHPHADTIRSEDSILTATGEGRVGFVDADDIAAVAVHALLDATAPNTDLIITGPQALSYGEIAATVARITGRAVHHTPIPYERMRERLAAAGIPAEFAALLAGMDRSIADGAEDRTTGTVEAITGRPPRSFAAYAAAHADSFRKASTVRA